MSLWEYVLIQLTINAHTTTIAIAVVVAMVSWFLTESDNIKKEVSWIIMFFALKSYKQQCLTIRLAFKSLRSIASWV